MQLNPATTSQSRTSALRFEGSSYTSPEVCAEIYAYIAARDLALASADRSPTEATFNRAYLANEMVGNCLKAARTPYQSQSLAPAEASRERSRCVAVTMRLAQLRTCLSAAA